MSLLTRREKKIIYSHLLEFFLIGLAMGIIEDILAIYFATDDPITWRTFKVAFLVALPFAFISEIIVDIKLLRHIIGKVRKRK
ncbi:MAG: hypothetical protein ABIB61_04230 [Candidatus Shapirobacteria bacterium]